MSFAGALAFGRTATQCKLSPSVLGSSTSNLFVAAIGLAAPKSRESWYQIFWTRTRNNPQRQPRAVAGLLRSQEFLQGAAGGLRSLARFYLAQLSTR